MTVELWTFGNALGVDAAELRGMSVEARDGGVGKVVDVVDRVDVAYLVVDTGPWIFGKEVVLPAGVITAVDTDLACVSIDCLKDDVKNAPESYSGPADDVAHRAALTAHYGAATTAASPSSAAETGAIESPATSSTVGTEPGAAPAALSRSDSDDADTDQAAEPELPAAIGAAWRVPDDGGGESLGSPSADSEHSDPAGDRASGFDAAAPRERAQEASEAVGEAEPGRTADAPARRRLARDAQPSTAKTETSSRAGGKARGAPSAGTSSDDVPIARYDSLTATQVTARLRNLSQRELAKVERYEKRHDGRQTVLSRIESLRESEPWRGYDDATVDEIRRRLVDANDDRARRVRDYERRHRGRKGVMEAARRTVASA